MQNSGTKEKFKKMSIPIEASEIQNRQKTKKIYLVFSIYLKMLKKMEKKTKNIFLKIYEILSKEGVFDTSIADARGKAECEKYIKSLADRDGFNIGQRYHLGNPYWQQANYYGNEVIQQSSMRAYVNIDKCGISIFTNCE